MDKKGIVIETCFNPSDNRPFVTVEGFKDLSAFYPQASFRVGKVVVEKTDEDAELCGEKRFKLRDIGSHTEIFVFAKLGAMNDIRLGDLVDTI